MFNQLEILSDEQSEKLYTIRRYIKNLDSVCIAYSGGVDSTLVASLAFEQLGSKAIAITGISPALANSLRQEARSQAKWIGVKHLEIKTSELEQLSYSKNPTDRCFACKKELHKHTTYLSKKLNYIFLYLLFISIILELAHLVIPNRSFQFEDLIGNITGVIISYILMKFYEFIRR